MSLEVDQLEPAGAGGEATHRLPPQVHMLTHEFYPKVGGIGLYVEETARALSRLGTRVCVWCPWRDELEGRDFPFDINPVRMRGTQDWDSRLQLIRALFTQVGEWRDAVVYLPEPGPIRTWQYLQYLPVLKPRHLVVTLHGTELEHLIRRWHRRATLRHLLCSADRVGTVSHYVQDRLLDAYPELTGRAVIAHGAVRSGLRSPMAVTERSTSITSAGQDVGGGCVVNEVRLVTLGRLHPRKGQLAVVEALAQLPAAMRELVQYRVIGPVVNEAYARAVRDAARTAQVNVVLTGELSDDRVASELDDADVFVMTSVPASHSIEGFGLVYLEAGFRGLPVVAHRIGGVADAVIHEETGLLVDPADRGALGAALTRLIESAELRERMGAAGRRWASRFDWETTAIKLFADL